MQEHDTTDQLIPIQPAAVVPPPDANNDHIYVKNFRLKVDSVDDQTGQFTAYASVFSVIDSDEEIVLPGAFTRSLTNNPYVIILSDHDVKKHIGYNIEALQDNYGLKVTGQLALDNSDARDKYALMKLAQTLNAKGFNARAGVSIGFRSIEDKMVLGRDLKGVKGAIPTKSYRCFVECALLEYSIVALQSCLPAFVTSVKSKFDAQQASQQEQEALMSDISTTESLDTLKTQVTALTALVTKSMEAQAAAIAVPPVSAPVSVKKTAATDFKDDEGGGDMGDDSTNGDDSPASFDDTMAAQTQEQELSDQRYRIEKSLSMCVDGIKDAGAVSKNDKKLKIGAAYHDYANAMTDWHSKALDAEYSPMTSDGSMKNADGTPIKVKAEGDAPMDPAKLALLNRMKAKAMQANTHLKSGKALHAVATDHITKSYKLLTEVSRNYFGNDVNLPHSVGGNSTSSPGSSDFNSMPKNDSGSFATKSDAEQELELNAALGDMLATFQF